MNLERPVMPHGQLKLKTRLKLKKLTADINLAVEENFGYCPSNDPRFDLLITERSDLESLAKAKFPDIYAEHERAVYCGAKRES